MARPKSCAEALQWDLCAKFGYCIGNDEGAAILASVPDTPEEFVDAVLRAEGRESSLVDTNHRGQLCDLARDWLFDEGKGRGARSGLPRLPSL
jgi:hypothetical protein